MEKKSTVEDKSVEKEDTEPKMSQIRPEKKSIVENKLVEKWILNLQNLNFA
jgi:hypothetical protein